MEANCSPVNHHVFDTAIGPCGVAWNARVLAAGGKLGGFSAHGGARTKAKLLALEGVHLDQARAKDEPPRLPGF